MPSSAISIAAGHEDRTASRVARKSQPPVFLHTGWRTSGTWLWSRFRGLPSVQAYYEPLNEILATLTTATLPSHHPDSWTSGHPRLANPYYHEYAELLRGGRAGIAHFQTDFAVADFFADATTDLPELRSYIVMLLGHADLHLRQAVMKFCRSIGRVGWMQRNFPDAVHVVALRNPASQFRSARWQYARHANPYFLAMPLLALAYNRDEVHVAEALRCFGVQLPMLSPHASAANAESTSHDYLRRTTPADWYRGFLTFWTLAVLSISGTVDCVIDSDLLTISPRYRAACQHDLVALTGIPVELGDELRAIETPAGIGVARAAIWQAHQAASALLVARNGTTWADTALGARIGAMLAHAELIAMDGHAALAARNLDRIVRRDRLRVLAEEAERELDRVYASRSWRLTEPLRQLHTLIRSTSSRLIPSRWRL